MLLFLLRAACVASLPPPSVLRSREAPRKRQLNPSRFQKCRKTAEKWRRKGLCTHNDNTANKKKRALKSISLPSTHVGQNSFEHAGAGRTTRAQ